MAVAVSGAIRRRVRVTPPLPPVALDPASMSDDKEHNSEHDDEQQHWVNSDTQYHGKDRDEQGNDYVKNHYGLQS
jgi:hypothetical protein